MPSAFSLCCIVVHIPWILEVIWRAFSILHCIVASFPCTLTICIFFLGPDNLYIFSWPCQLNLSVTVNIYQQLPVPLKTRSENQRLQNFYSIIHPYSTCTVSHQDYLIIPYMYIYTRYCNTWAVVFCTEWRNTCEILYGCPVVAWRIKFSTFLYFCISR